MLTIISRRKIAFFNPNIPVLETGTGPKSPKYSEAVFVTKGNGEIEKVPDWVNKPLGPRKRLQPTDAAVDLNQQNLNTWKLHEADGHIMEIDVKKGAATGLEEEAAARQAEIARKAGETPEYPVKTPDELERMTKNELLDHAEEAHGIRLDVRTPKSDIVSAITQAQVAKANAA
jgi:hypothetical protein